MIKQRKNTMQWSWPMTLILIFVRLLDRLTNGAIAEVYGDESKMKIIADLEKRIVRAEQSHLANEGHNLRTVRDQIIESMRN
jgi:hypothetical protein